MIFPSPSQANRDGGNPFIPPRIIKPNFGRQGERLTPRFQELERVFAARQVTLQNDPTGTMPEQVLVLETIGSIKDFMNAVRRIQGLEWMAEQERDFEPDEDFFLEGEPEKPLSGRLYLVLTNQQALNSLRSLWNRFLADPHVQFQHGQNKFKVLFKQLRDIRPWDLEDRLRDTGVEDYWRERVELGEELVRFEAELWYRQRREDQQRSEGMLRSSIEQLEGCMISSSIIPEIQYHGVLAELPIGQIRSILTRVDIRLLTCDQVMFFHPMGQTVIPHDKGERSVVEDATLGQEIQMPRKRPVVALLDGLPMQNHSYLAGRLIIDDPDGWSKDYQARERKHGTSMASLIIHGDLENRETALERPIYVRPILRPNKADFREQRFEEMPWECLPIDLVHRAVRRLFDGEGSESPQAPEIKIINLSICDKNRPFDRVVSPWARLIDWLSWHYKVLVLISGGNQLSDLVLDVSPRELVQMDPVLLEEKILRAVIRDARQRRLLSPAEAINSITVGATHEDSYNTFILGNRINPCITSGMPNPISPIGLGYRRAIKPEIFIPGGKQLYQEPIIERGAETTLKVACFTGRQPGQKVAYPGPEHGITQGIAYTCGTSNATALATRTAARLYEYIVEELRHEPGGEQLQEQYIAVLLKTLLVHGAEWGEAYSRFAQIFRTPQNSQTFRDFAARFFGYGQLSTEKLFNCTDQRVTLIGCGNLGDGQAHIYRLPLPPSLSGRRDNRRLIITLSWQTPINTGHQSYRQAALWFDPPRGPLGIERRNADWRMVRRGTVQHEVLEGENAVAFTDGSFLEIKINCRADAGNLLDTVPYGVVVTLEVKEEVNLPIYQEVRERIRPLVPVLPE